MRECNPVFLIANLRERSYNNVHETITRYRRFL
jgi:hypothetical protein